jgi:hypothetical protein
VRDLDQAQPASADGFQRFVIAKRRDRDALTLGHVEDGHPLLGLEDTPVDFKSDRFLSGHQITSTASTGQTFRQAPQRVHFLSSIV